MLNDPNLTETMRSLREVASDLEQRAADVRAFVQLVTNTLEAGEETEAAMTTPRGSFFDNVQRVLDDSARDNRAAQARSRALRYLVRAYAEHTAGA